MSALHHRDAIWLRRGEWLGAALRRLLDRVRSVKRRLYVRAERTVRPAVDRRFERSPDAGMSANG